MVGHRKPNSCIGPFTATDQAGQTGKIVTGNCRYDRHAEGCIAYR